MVDLDNNFQPADSYATETGDVELLLCPLSGGVQSTLPRRGAQYCDQHVCMALCLPAYMFMFTNLWFIACLLKKICEFTVYTDVFVQ